MVAYVVVYKCGPRVCEDFFYENVSSQLMSDNFFFYDDAPF